MAIIDFASVWGKTTEFINSKWKGSSFKGQALVDERMMDSVVRDFLNDLEAAFAFEYESRFSPQRYPFAGLISESRVVRTETLEGYDYVISFGGNDGELCRSSLLIKSTGRRTRRGVRNIISLFDRGYSHTHLKWGLWHSRSRGKSIHTKARMTLDGLDVIKNFVDEFTNRHKDIGIVAELIAPSEYYAR